MPTVHTRSRALLIVPGTQGVSIKQAVPFNSAVKAVFTGSPQQNLQPPRTKPPVEQALDRLILALLLAQKREAQITYCLCLAARSWCRSRPDAPHSTATGARYITDLLLWRTILALILST